MKTRLVVLASILIVAVACGQLACAAGKTYYVSTTGDDSAKGLTEATAWRTITRAAKVAGAGDTVKIKAGKYNNEHAVIANRTGTKADPIVFEGYGGTPELDGLDGTGNGIALNSSTYVELKNLKVTRYNVGCYVSGPGASHIVLRNVTAYLNDIGVLFAKNPTVGGEYNTIVDCTAYNNEMHNIVLWGGWTNCLIENCRSYNRHGLGNYADYFYALNGGANHNTIKNCVAGGYPESKHRWSGHGYSLRIKASHNKVINCRSYNTGCEHYKVSEDSDHNEFVNCIAAGTHSAAGSYRKNKKWKKATPSAVVGFHIKSSHNKVINCVAKDVGKGISLYWSKAESSRRPLTGNLFENNILVNNHCGIRFYKDGVDGKKNTAKYNNVWGNKVNYQNCPAGTGDISKDPLFADAVKYDFHLKSRYGRWDGKKWIKDKTTSPCIDVGDPKSKWKNEPAQNGGRVNIGAYGNTRESSRGRTKGLISSAGYRHNVRQDEVRGLVRTPNTGKLAGRTLEDLRKEYRRWLFDDFLPFYDKHVIDHKYGGFMTHVGRDGTRRTTDNNTDKRTWHQGRGIWVYSFLYNKVDPDPKHLEIARKAVEYVLKTKPSGKNLWPKMFTRDGKPLGLGKPDTNIYGDLFIADGLQEYSKASGEKKYWDMAKEIMLKCIDIYDNRPDYENLEAGEDVPEVKRPRSIGHWFMLLRLSTQMLEKRQDLEVQAVADRCLDAIMNHHYNPDYRLNDEYVNHDLSRIKNDHGRLVTGHALEALWMVMHEAVRRKDRRLFDTAAKRLKRHMEVFWDDVYGGLMSGLQDVEKNKWNTAKPRWLQEEVLIGTLFVINHTGDQWAKDWFSRTYTYLLDRFAFPSRKQGLFWIVAGDRKVTCEQNTAYIDIFHGPRHLMINLLMLESMIGRSGKVSGFFGRSSRPATLPAGKGR